MLILRYNFDSTFSDDVEVAPEERLELTAVVREALALEERETLLQELRGSDGDRVPELLEAASEAARRL